MKKRKPQQRKYLNKRYIILFSSPTGC